MHAATQPTTPTRSHAQTAPAAVQALTVDAVHSCALFRVRHLGAGFFWGRFNAVTGTIQETPGSALALDITIRVDSVDSGNDQLDAHLKSPDFFNSVEFPSMTFKSTGAKFLGDGRYEVAGDITIRGVTKQISVPVESFGGADFGKGYRAGFEATFTIKRSEFGVNYGVEGGAIGDDVKVVVSLEGTAPKQ